jgi:hypothetical protein
VGIPLIAFSAREILRQRHVWRTGTTVAAVVSTVIPSATVINGIRQWEIRYVYTDASGTKREGRSDCMPEEEAKMWHGGDRCSARVDPRNPASSVWVGSATDEKNSVQ